MADWNHHRKDLPQAAFKIITQVLFFSTVNVHSMANDQDVKKKVEQSYLCKFEQFTIKQRAKYFVKYVYFIQFILFYSCYTLSSKQLEINELLNSLLALIIYILPSISSTVPSSLPPSSFLSFLSFMFIEQLTNSRHLGRC